MWACGLRCSPENFGCRVDLLDAEKDGLVSKGHLQAAGQQHSRQERRFGRCLISFY
jgi:hypothetical protein